MTPGHRQLNEEETALVLKIRAMGEQLERLCKEVHQHALIYLVTSPNSDPITWALEGKAELQKGLMSLTRSVTRPTFF